MEQQPEEIHVSVLLEEVISFLNPVAGGLYVDGTVGLGGHSLEILRRSAPSGRLIGFDWDEAAIALAHERLKEHAGRYQIIRRNFSELAEGLAAHNISEIDGLLIDIGLSSLQLDCGGRGFSFQRDEPLDMRMDVRVERTAADLVNGCGEEELADIFYYYGEERQARRMAAAIIKARQGQRIESSAVLADVLYAAVPKRFHPKKIHVATKAFQALRIAVNRELENLAVILDDAVDFLKPGARFCVVAFHSLEDKMVKKKFKDNQSLKILTSKPVVAGDAEVRVNPRSRSARLRVAEKI